MAGRSSVDVSVVIPCRDLGRYLFEAVQSAICELDSAGLAGEVVVVDDRSRDPQTLEVLRELARLPAVRVISNRGPAGPGAARNTGIQAAQGVWVAFLDGDDVWLPGALATRWRVVRDEPQAAWLGTDYALWYPDEPSRLVEGWQFDERGRVDNVLKRRPSSSEILAASWERGDCIRLPRPVALFAQAMLAWTGTVLVRKDLLQAIGGFDERLMIGEDIHMWIRLANKTDYFFLPEVTALYRQRRGSLMNSELDPQADNRRRIKVIECLLRDNALPSFTSELKSRLIFLHLDDAYGWRRSGRFMAAIDSTLGAIRYGPTSGAAWRNLAACVLCKR